MRWPMKAYRDRGPNMLSDKVEGYLRRGETLTIDDYRRCLAWRERLRNRFMVAAGLEDGFVSLTSPGPAPLRLESTGNPTYQTPRTAARPRSRSETTCVGKERGRAGR